jgi:hypothetical protein
LKEEGEKRRRGNENGGKKVTYILSIHTQPMYLQHTFSMV